MFKQLTLTNIHGYKETFIVNTDHIVIVEKYNNGSVFVLSSDTGTPLIFQESIDEVLMLLTKSGE